MDARSASFLLLAVQHDGKAGDSRSVPSEIRNLLRKPFELAIGLRSLPFGCQRGGILQPSGQQREKGAKVVRFDVPVPLR